MHARGALVSMIVAAGLSLAGCALIDELKDTVSKMARTYLKIVSWSRSAINVR